MAIIEMLRSEYEREIATTRPFLERVPVRDAEWRPHPKSTPLGNLAVHVATLPWWAAVTLTTTELDLATLQRPPALTTVEALLARFDENAALGRAALAKAVDADLDVPWSLRAAEQVYWTLPRGTVLRSFAFSHLIHHRAQLGVYLRLRDVPLPPSYGPTADEAP
jgi:uncharacterized damage-inducible protein DinB